MDPWAGVYTPMPGYWNRLEARVFGTITTLGTPQDVTLQELRIETFLPADAATEELARRLAAEEARRS